MHLNKGFMLFICLLGTSIQVSCRNSINIGQEDLSGLWVIDGNCLPILERLGFSIFTNRHDHMIMLNADGTCVYRAMDIWYPQKKFWNDIYYSDVEYDLLESYPDPIWYADMGCPTKARLNNIERAWYLLDVPNGEFSGPYFSTNAPLPSSQARFHVNRWTRWRVEPKGSRRHNECDHMSPVVAECPCHIRVINRSDNGSEIVRYIHVGIDDNGLFLWLPTYQNHDYLGPEQIKFRKEETIPRN